MSEGLSCRSEFKGKSNFEALLLLTLSNQNLKQIQK
jgi:hypothetical protein